MSRKLVFTESVRGDRLHIPLGGVVLASTRGSSVLNYNIKTMSFGVNSKYVDSVIDSVKPNVVYMGTDLDRVGTLIATVLKQHIEDKKGIPVVRFAYTAKGYVAMGGFYGKDQMKVVAQMSKRNIEFASKMKKRFGKSMGWETAVGVKAVLKALKNGIKEFQRVSSGTNTVTYTTMAALSGIDGIRRLEALYASGHVAYPRVDNDYRQETPYQLYPHPELGSKGYSDAFLKPLPPTVRLTVSTMPLYLNTIGLLPPSSYSRMKKVFSELFVEKSDGSIAPKNDRAAQILAYIDQAVPDEDLNRAAEWYRMLYNQLPIMWIRESELPLGVDAAYAINSKLESMRDDGDLVFKQDDAPVEGVMAVSFNPADVLALSPVGRTGGKRMTMH